MKIAIIDDDPVFRFVTGRLIDKVSPEQELSYFENGEDAIEFIFSNRLSPDLLPDLILVDINMPVMNGWEFLESLRQLAIEHYRPNIYMVSSSVDGSDRVKADTYGELCQYLTKPLSIEQVSDVLQAGPC